MCFDCDILVDVVLVVLMYLVPNGGCSVVVYDDLW
jgi:hypothetical protein